MSYLHGIEIKEGAKRTILTAGDTSTIALVGTAPKGEVGKIKLITSIEAARAEYGADVEGFTIPGALEVIFSTIGAKVLVLNVLAADKVAALLEGEKMIRTEAGEPVTALYKATLPEAVDYAADIMAGLEAMTKVDDALGVKPNIILAPGYSGIAAVSAKMIAAATKLEGFAVVDIVAGDVQAALEARASGAYSTASAAAVLCYPQAKRFNEHEGAEVFHDGNLGPATQVASGLMSAADKTKLNNMTGGLLAGYRILASGYIFRGYGPKASINPVVKLRHGHFTVFHNIGDIEYIPIATAHQTGIDGDSRGVWLASIIDYGVNYVVAP